MKNPNAGAEALAQENASHAAAVARMRQVMDGFIPFVAFVDFDVPGDCVVRHAAVNSKLRRSPDRRGR